MDTILRWAGSKRQLLSKLKAYWTSDNARYVEPFCGSACFFFDLEPQRAILGDLNGELINTYRALKKDVEQVCDHLRDLPKSKIACRSNGKYYNPSSTKKWLNGLRNNGCR